MNDAFFMTRPLRIFRNIAIALAGLIVILAIAAILIVRSAWFENYVKQTIITSVEDSTGGRAEIGSIRFDWTSLTAVVTDFVIHGTEPSNTAPLVRVARVQLNFRLFTSLHHLWDITYLGVDRPQANMLVYRDGGTNIPSPRQKSSSAPLQTVVDLAIGRFELTNGLIALGDEKTDEKQPLNVRGNNLRAQLSFNVVNQEYRGRMSLHAGRNTPVELTVNVPMVRRRIVHQKRDGFLESRFGGRKRTMDFCDLAKLDISFAARGQFPLGKKHVRLPHIVLSRRFVVPRFGFEQRLRRILHRIFIQLPSGGV